MPENRSRRFIFPLVLILIGVVLMVEQLGIWSLNWAGLWQLWPLILVFIGLEILFRHTRASGVVSLLLAIGVVALVAVLLLSGKPQRPGYEREAFSYPLKGLEAASVRLEVGVGRLEVRPLDDGDRVLEAEIQYDKGAARLIRDISEKDKEIRVTLRTTGGGRVWSPFSRSLEENWRIGLSTRIPLSLDINSGVNRSRLDLTGLKLRRLALNAGVGDSEVTLPDAGAYEVSINGGVGAVKLEIPERMEARIRVDGGLGAIDVGRRYEHQGKYYVTEGYAAAEDKADIEIDGGVGSITIR